MRLFVAIRIPEETRESLHGALEPMREGGYPVRWTDPDRYHLTLKFLGSVRPEAVPVVAGVLRRVARETPPFRIELSRFGAFPTIRRPRVLWVGADPSPALRCLKQDLEWGLAAHGFQRETQAFHPHVTVGRARENEGAGAFRDLDDTGERVGLSQGFRLESMALVRSSPGKGGMIHRTLEEAPLGRSGVPD
ncbi:MAG: RNA 2',3'-cyclic phosphodiesterase [Gemmatimonadales bacterium]|nr:MAG: RNA 2',3'-cyclic phosphodiesterase [Gemmatimonadales bacterium]